MADEIVQKVDLSTAHPEIAERHGRMQVMLAEALAVTRAGGDGTPLRAEAGDLIRWAEAVAAEAVGDLAAFRARMDKDRPAFALALRLSGDDLIARQVLTAADDLKTVIGPA